VVARVVQVARNLLEVDPSARRCWQVARMCLPAPLSPAHAHWWRVGARVVKVARKLLEVDPSARVVAGK
jgi:hypothetical protein